MDSSFTDVRHRKTEKNFFVQIFSTLLKITSEVFVTQVFTNKLLLKISKEILLSMLISHDDNPPNLTTIPWEPNVCSIIIRIFVVCVFHTARLDLAIKSLSLNLIQSCQLACSRKGMGQSSQFNILRQVFCEILEEKYCENYCVEYYGKYCDK